MEKILPCENKTNKFKQNCCSVSSCKFLTKGVRFQ